MTAQDVLPLITTSAGCVALVLGFLLLVLEHHAAPLTQKASVGLLMFAVLATVDEACRCAVSQLTLDWRLPMFVVGLMGAWGFRVCGHFRKRKRFMKLSDQGLALLSDREGGFVLTPYQDSEGIWTDGLGNTHGVVPNGPPISLEKAKADFARNLAWVEGAIAGNVHGPLEQYQHDALGSFIFNIDGGAFASSTVLHRINAGDMEGAAAAFDMWRIPPEITSRRNGEREQFKGVKFAARLNDKGEPV